MKAADFSKLNHGPFGLRWSYTYDPEESPPSVLAVAKILGVKLAPETEDASGERADGLAEVIYFAAEEYDQNSVATYLVQ